MITTWNKIASYIKRVTKKVLGESRGGAPPCKDAYGEMKRYKLPLRSNETLTEI